MKIKYFLIVIVILLILGTGIAIGRMSYQKEASISQLTSIDHNDLLGEVFPMRFHDDGMIATCWYDAENGLDVPVSISCLPDYMLNRPKDYNPME